MSHIVSLCKRRGIVFPSSEIYGGLRSFYDYGPIGLAIKKNIAAQWWHHMVDLRDNVVGLDASTIMHPKVWEASGHAAGFSDPLVDCRNCKARFRSDKQPKLPADHIVKWIKNVAHSSTSTSTSKTPQRIPMETPVGERGYVCPECSSTDLSEERHFCGMFRTFLGAIDPIAELQEGLKSQEGVSQKGMKKLTQNLMKSSAYLRPETAQAMFVQFGNIQQSMGLKIPFGIAQQGKSYRNEIVVEHFIFRSCEFEQMEMEFFCEPGTENTWLDYWCKERMAWYHRFANHKDHFRLRSHDDDELAHYSKACYDIEYLYPWGWDELEGVALRGDYDLTKHSQASGSKLSYFDPHKTNPTTQKPGYRYTPQVVEPAAGLTRALLAFLLDAYSTETITTPSGASKTRTFLRLHPTLAPYQVAILPLIKNDNLLAMAGDIAQKWRNLGMILSMDWRQSVGKRYAKHDEIGTPYAITIDEQSLTDNTVTLRHRDTTQQERLPIEQARDFIHQHTRTYSPGG